MSETFESNYIFKKMPYGEIGFSKYEDLFDRNSMPRVDGALEWQHVKNPAGSSSRTDFAVDKALEETAAVYSVMGVKMLIDGYPHVGGQSLDTLTDAKHRRRGLFKMLAKHSYEQLAKSGHSCVYGFPNANSHTTFQNHLEWTIYGQVDLLIRPLRAGYFLRTIIGKLEERKWLKYLNFKLPMGRCNDPRVVMRPLKRFNAGHEAIWYKVASKVRISVDRSAEYLNWRLFDRPDATKYQVWEAIEVGPDGENEKLLGFVAWCVENKHRGRIGYLMECLALVDHPTAYSDLLQKAIKQMQDDGADLVLSWTPKHQFGYSEYRSRGFIKVPEIFRPFNLYWGMHSFNPEKRFKPTDWYISYLDSDTV
tara:strand:- start:20231 stop:21325 length:1095 start_codon:yes stop_codon:yes gene_type:complete